MPDIAALDPLLLPAPRRLERRDGWCTADAVPATTTDAAVPAEGYRLAIGPEGVAIAHRDEAGLRHARATLAQLRTQYGDRLPALVIEDAPAFAVRGFMLDISRDRVPTMDELLRLVDQLAAWKLNHLQLYTEHTFAYRGHEEVWRDCSPLTPDEVRALDSHARARGVTLAANQNCLGHLERWFDHPRYQALAEIAPGQAWDFGGIARKSGPFSLCPADPGAAALVEDLLGQLLPCFSAPLVNIGCDEAYDLGQGRSRAVVAERGRAPVYLEWVARVCQLARRHGKRPLFWADIALEHPEALAGLPSDVVGLAWGYEPDAPFGRWCHQLSAAGREAWVCPGTSCWNSLTGRSSERHANLMAATRDGLGHGARGFLLTAWGDFGHRQQWPITLHALAEGAHRAWSGTAPWRHAAASLHAFGDRELGVAGWLEKLGDADHALREVAGRDGGPLRNQSALFADARRAWGEPGPGTARDWMQVVERLTALRDRCPNPPAFATELRHSAAVARWHAQRAAVRRGITIPTATLANTLRPLVDEHRRLWLARSRPGGLERSCAHYQRLIDELDARR